MNDKPIDVTTDMLAAALEQQVAGWEAEADAGHNHLLGAMLPSELADSLAALQRRKLALAKWTLAQHEAQGGDTTFAALSVRKEAAIYRTFGGDPDTVAGDHVNAWVVGPPGDTLTYGFNAVPETLARFDPAANRYVADLADVSEILGFGRP